MPATTRKASSKASKPTAAKLPKVGTVPANVHTLAQLVAQLPAQGTAYASAANLFAAACPNGYPRTLGTQGRHCLRAQALGVGRGKRHSITPRGFIAAYNATHPNKAVQA
jgi:hypothetical protein